VDLPTIANTGATQHTTNQRDLLHDFIPLAVPSRLVCADGGYIKCLGHGTLRSTTTVNGVPSSIVMRDVAFMPSASHTLISPQQLLDSGCRIMFNQQNGFLFYLNEQLCLFSYRSGNLYYFAITFIPAADASTPAALVVSSTPLCLDLIHRRLGHVSEERCREFIRQSADFGEHEKRAALSSKLSPHCDVCLAGKQTVRGVSRVPRTNHAVRGACPGNLLSLDLIGPMRHRSAGGHIYLLTVTDLYSRMHFVRPLPNKTSVAVRAALRAIAASFPPSVRVHHVRLDNARELDALVGEWILEIGAKREPTPPYTSEYNGVTERFNREVMTRVRCLLFDARLPSEWWAEAARYACDVINVTPTRSNPDSASPFSLWHGVAPPSRHLRVFGAPGTMRLQAHERHKVSAQSIPVRFMGVVDYSSSTYCVYIVGQWHVVDTHSVIFNEHCMLRPPDDHLQPALVYVPLLNDNDDDAQAGNEWAGTPVSPTPDHDNMSAAELSSTTLALTPTLTTVSPTPNLNLHTPEALPPPDPTPTPALASRPELHAELSVACPPTMIIDSVCGSMTSSSKQIQ
jgi:transposase InsO family protein